MRLWCLSLLGLVSLAQAAERKVTIIGLEAVPELRREAEAATDAAALAIGDLPGVRATVVRPADEQATPKLLSPGELGRQVAAATGAELVLFGAVLRLDTESRLLISVAGYDRLRDEVLLAEPVELERPRRLGATREFAQLVATWFQRIYRRWNLTPAAVATSGEAPLMQVRLSRPLAVENDAFRIFRRPAPVTATSAADAFAGSPVELGLADLVRSEGVSAWFTAPAGWGLSPGDELLIAPANDPPARALPAGLLVSSRPVNAVVRLDGRILGVTPLFIPRAEPRPVELIITHRDMLPWRREVTAAAGLLEVALAPAGGGARVAAPAGITVRVESSPAGAEVWVDGEVRGLTPLELKGLIGQPKLVVKRDGYEDWEAQVLANGPLTLRAELRPGFGGLEIVTTPPGLEIFVDDQRQGLAPLRLTGVPTGDHEVRAVQRGREVRRPIRVRSGEVTRLDLSLSDGAATVGEGAAPVVPGATPTLPVPAEDRDDLTPGKLLWEQKRTAGRATLHLASAALEGGSVLSLTLAPPATYLAEPVEGGFEISYPGLALDATAWEPEAVPEIRRIEIRSAATFQGTTVRLILAPHVVARAHPSSTLQRVRVVLKYQPED